MAAAIKSLRDNQVRQDESVVASDGTMQDAGRWGESSGMIHTPTEGRALSTLPGHGDRVERRSIELSPDASTCP
jgi:hypothetical protein